MYLHILRKTSCPNLLPILLCLWLWGGFALQAAEHTVETDGVTFVPAELTIEVGDTVTWVNADGGFHNVIADDGTFDSGDPSSDPWQYSYTFREGGTWGYSCEVHVGLGMTGTVIVQGVFGDGLESGDSTAWTEEGPPLPSCHCYFSGDCAGVGEFCNWGVLTQEDNCLWRENKPNGVPGAGCDVDFPGITWTSGICDGICTQSSFGSSLGLEDRDVLIEGIQLWAEALLGPAEAGGGEIDPELAEQVLSLPFEGGANRAWILGRQVGDLLGTVGVEGLDVQYCHYESHPDEPAPTQPDLSEDPCLAAVARLTIEALVAEIYEPGSGPRVLDALSGCRDRARIDLFEGRCPSGSGNLDCAAQRIAAAAEFLTTPPSSGSAAGERDRRSP